MTTPAPIGIFDSGVGGLSVLRAIRRQLPNHPLVYLGDQAHVPYGKRTEDEVRAFSEAITRFLLEQGARIIVVACNAASAASLYHLRATFPEVPFVGMEPAVKPAAEKTASGVVGVLATPVTFQGKLYASVVERFAKGVKILEDVCPGLVGEIEQGNLSGARTRQILERAIAPMLAQGADTIVMGCTHYPFVIPLIQEIAGPGVQVIDPSPAIARQVERLLAEHKFLSNDLSQPPGSVDIFTSGVVEKLVGTLPILLQEEYPIHLASWHYGKIHSARCIL